LWLETHPLPTTSNKMGIEDVGVDHINGKGDRPIGKKGPKNKTKPTIAARPQ
jgi:hypothetical protein